jgi:hypothetical protein
MSGAMVTMVINTSGCRSRRDVAIASPAAPAATVVAGIMTGGIISAMPINGKSGGIEDEIEWSGDSL